MILSVVPYEIKNMIFNQKNLKLTKSYSFNNVFCNRIFPYCPFFPNLKKLLDFHESWFIFSGKIFSTTLLCQILKVKFSVAEIAKRIFLKETIFSS